jgi:hypothetical protein
VLLLRHEAFSQRLRHLQQALDEHKFFMIAWYFIALKHPS